MHALWVPYEVVYGLKWLHSSTTYLLLPFLSPVQIQLALSLCLEKNQTFGHSPKFPGIVRANQILLHVWKMFHFPLHYNWENCHQAWKQLNFKSEGGGGGNCKGGGGGGEGLGGSRGAGECKGGGGGVRLGVVVRVEESARVVVRSGVSGPSSWGANGVKRNWRKSHAKAFLSFSTFRVGSVVCPPRSPVRCTTKLRARIIVFNIKVPITTGFMVSWNCVFFLASQYFFLSPTKRSYRQVWYLSIRLPSKKSDYVQTKVGNQKREFPIIQVG